AGTGEGDRVDLVATGADHTGEVRRGLLVGGEDLRVHDRRDTGGELVRQGRVSGVEVEDHAVGARGVHRLDGAEDRDGAVRVVDLQHAVDGELDRAGVQRVTVGELEVRTQRALVRLGVREGTRLRGVELRRVAAGRVAQQALVDVVEHRPRA